MDAAGSGVALRAAPMSSLAPLSRSPAALRREDERARRVLGMITLVGAATHVAMGLSFLAAGVRWLSACNVGSVLVFLGAYELVRRGDVVLPSVRPRRKSLTKDRYFVFMGGADVKKIHEPSNPRRTMAGDELGG